MLISQTSDTKEIYHVHMQQMIDNMRAPLRELGDALGSQTLAQGIDVLQQAADHIDQDLANLALAQKLFRDDIMQFLLNN